MLRFNRNQQIPFGIVFSFFLLVHSRGFSFGLHQLSSARCFRNFNFEINKHFFGSTAERQIISSESPFSNEFFHPNLFLIIVLELIYRQSFGISRRISKELEWKRISSCFQNCGVSNEFIFFLDYESLLGNEREIEGKNKKLKYKIFHIFVKIIK